MTGKFLTRVAEDRLWCLMRSFIKVRLLQGNNIDLPKFSQQHEICKESRFVKNERKRLSKVKYFIFVVSLNLNLSYGGKTKFKFII